MNDNFISYKGSNVDVNILEKMTLFLDYIHKIISGEELGDVPFYDFSCAYLRTTENVNGYYDQLDFKDKNVLTVVGASDQIFEAVLRGAKKVSGFDISMNSIMFYYLKEAAIKSLDFEDYLDFFFVENRCFKKETYDKISNNLNGIAKPFWDTIFNSPEPFAIISKLLKGSYIGYANAVVAENKLSLLSSHLNRENYNVLKRNINNCNIDIYLSDVKQLDRIEGNFDYMILSNIFEYQKDGDLDEFKNAIERYRAKINEGGKIIVGYAYHDIDLSQYSEYDEKEVPSRYTAMGMTSAPNDRIITTGKKKG